MKRKRSQSGREKARKQPKIEPMTSTSSTSTALLQLYYPRVQSLRSYLLSELPPSSKHCWKLASRANTATETSIVEDVQTTLNDLLDSIVIGSFDTKHQHDAAKRQEEVELYSQHINESTGSTIPSQGFSSQAEVG